MYGVTIFTEVDCGYCASAKALLESKRVTYKEIDVSANTELRRSMMNKSGGQQTVPQIFVGDKHIGDSDAFFALERAGKLDALLRGQT